MHHHLVMHVDSNLKLLGREDKVQELPDADEQDEHDGEEDGGGLEGLDQPQRDEAEQLQPGEEMHLGWRCDNSHNTTDWQIYYP